MCRRGGMTLRNKLTNLSRNVIIEGDITYKLPSP